MEDCTAYGGSFTCEEPELSFPLMEFCFAGGSLEGRFKVLNGSKIEAFYFF